MKRLMTVALMVGLLGVLAATSVWAGDTETCAALTPDIRFIDLDGNTVDPAQMDVIAVQEVDRGTVLVYRRTTADAEALVQGLKADGESESVWLTPANWLVAQGPAGCQMRRGSCNGRCPGQQQCRRVRPGACACMR